jgi:hypothetical protein
VDAYFEGTAPMDALIKPRACRIKDIIPKASNPAPMKMRGVFPPGGRRLPKRFDPLVADTEGMGFPI